MTTTEKLRIVNVTRRPWTPTWKNGKLVITLTLRTKGGAR